MGNVEQRARTDRRKRNIQQAVLGVVATAGLLAVATVVPNVFQALPKLMGKDRYRLTFGAERAITRLAIKKYIRFVERDGRKYVEITDAGRRELALAQARADRSAMTRRKRWDKRYRLVIFDIPQERKAVRDHLRRLMSDFGFLRIQNSVWLSPYECEELVILAKAKLKLGKDVLYVVVESIENDTWIREHFHLR